MQKSIGRTTLIVLSLTLIGGFQNCGPGFGVLAPETLELSSTSRTSFGQIGIDRRFSFSYNSTAPSSKQGTGEARTTMSRDEFNARYNVLKGMGIGYRQYNLWWSALESSGLASSATPPSCPRGYQSVPSNEAERVAKGFKRFRCVHSETLSTFDNLFKRDEAAGFQSGVVLWSSPPVYRYPQCEGFSFGGNFLKDPCVPRDDAMDDFEDYVNLVASRWNGDGKGKVSHFIVWNENASAEWFDYTPMVSRTDLSSASVERRIDKYADMMKRAHNTLSRHQRAAMLYASTDQLWEPGQHPGHFGTRWLLDGLWARLGTEYSWSVAVHPYGDPAAGAPSGQYTFHNLELVSNHQAIRLRERGITDVLSYPQSYLIASEQGWPVADGGRTRQARNICLAHDKVMKMPEVVAVAHNYFHSVEPSEIDPNGQSGQGAFFGLIPYSIPNSLSGVFQTETGQAFASTANTDIWGKSDTHYCCREHKVGCKGAVTAPPPLPNMEPAPVTPPDEITDPTSPADFSIISVHRFLKPERGAHFFTTNKAEGQSYPGFLYEGIGFSLFTSGSGGRRPIYRCYTPTAGDHFLSLEAGCEGQTLEGIMGYVDRASGNRSQQALYRCHKNSSGHLTTTNKIECEINGYVVEATLGYVP